MLLICSKKQRERPPPNPLRGDKSAGTSQNVTRTTGDPLVSPPQRPLCVAGRLGERKRKRAGRDGKGKEKREIPAFSLFPSSSARFLFFDCERFEPRSHFKSRLSLIVRVNVVLNNSTYFFIFRLLLFLLEYPAEAYAEDQERALVNYVET